MQNIFEILVGILLGRRCVSCGSYHSACGAQCSRCWRDLQFLTHPRSYDPRIDHESRLRARPLFLWVPDGDPRLAELIHAQKGVGHGRGWRWLARAWFQHQRPEPPLDPHRKPRRLILIPAPSATGGAHAHEWAGALAELCGGEVHDVLELSGNSQQRGRGRRERRTRRIRLREHISPGWDQGAHLVLVDDVVTTGATAQACRKALGLSRLEIWCLAYRSRLAAKP